MRSRRSGLLPLATGAAVAVLCAALGCRADEAPSTSPEAAADDTVTVPFQTLAKGSQSGIRAAHSALIRTEAGWEALWREHASVTVPPPPAPEVDWTSEMLVAVFLGERPTAGYAIGIEAIEGVAGTLRITTRETRPEEGAFVAEVITSPFHLVSTARSDAPADFQTR